MKIEGTIQSGEQIKRNLAGRFLLVRNIDYPIKISVQGMEDVFLKNNDNYEFIVDVSGKEVLISSQVAATNRIHLESNEGRLTALAELAGDTTINTSTSVENGNSNNGLDAIVIEPMQSALIAPANEARQTLRLSMLSNAQGHITIGDSQVTASTGGTLEAGQIDYMDTRGAIHAMNPNNNSITVYVMEVNKL